MTMPHAYAGSVATTMDPGSLAICRQVDLRTPIARAPSAAAPFPVRTALDRQGSCGKAARGRAPECKSLSPTSPPGKGASSRVSDAPDTGACDPVGQARCRRVAEMVEELTMMVGDRPQLRRDRRRMMTHVRQIAMYVSHVVLQVSLTDIGVAFGRDRSTVSYSCHVVEDRRDDADFDAFVCAIERVVTAAFLPEGDAGHA